MCGANHGRWRHRSNKLQPLPGPASASAAGPCKGAQSYRYSHWPCCPALGDGRRRWGRAHLHAALPCDHMQRRAAAFVLEQRANELQDEGDLVLHRRQVHRRAPEDVLLQQQRWPTRRRRQSIDCAQVAAHDRMVQRRAPLTVAHSGIRPLRPSEICGSAPAPAPQRLAALPPSTHPGGGCRCASPQRRFRHAKLPCTTRAMLRFQGLLGECSRCGARWEHGGGQAGGGVGC